MIETREKILETAERLFAEQGYSATSMRHIIADAGVNLAAIHYHFGSKEDLLDELVARGAGPVNQARLAMLDQCEASPPATVKEILEAFLLPISGPAEHRPQFVRLMGRIYAEGLMPGLIQKHFQVVVARFVAALGKALPELSEEELLWRVHFMIGAMAHAMCWSPSLLPLPNGGDFKTRIGRLITFVTGGFRAPVMVAEAGEVHG
jgi:AcrR family transcriptional regulator